MGWLGWLGRLWLRITMSGVDDAGSADGRLVRLINEAALLTSVSCLQLGIFFLLQDASLWLLIVNNAVTAALAPVTIVLNHRGRRRAANRLLFTLVWLPATVAVLSVGPDAGFQVFMLLAVPVALVAAGSDRVIHAMCGLAAATYVAVELFTSSATAWYVVAPRILDAVNVGSHLLAVAIVVILVLRLHAAVGAAERSLTDAHARSERLLLNVLPRAISERLKGGAARIADGHDEVTVLFADLVGFTELSSRMTPDDLVALLDEVFSAFDALTARLGGEKIKTIGDAYMVGFGLPTARADHAHAAVELALAMRDELAALARRRGLALRLRLGLHSGAVVAGVIGQAKFSYDVWGDTVNTASRMESHGVVDEIHLTDAVRARIERDFVVRPRGSIAIKGKGEMQTFLLEGRRESASSATLSA